MKLPKYFLLVVSVLSDQLSFNRQLNANRRHVLRRNRVRPNKLFISVRCVGNGCNSEDAVGSSRFDPGVKTKPTTGSIIKNRRRQRYKRMMRSQPWRFPRHQLTVKRKFPAIFSNTISGKSAGNLRYFRKIRSFSSNFLKNCREFACREFPFRLYRVFNSEKE